MQTAQGFCWLIATYLLKVLDEHRKGAMARVPERSVQFADCFVVTVAPSVQNKSDHFIFSDKSYPLITIPIVDTFNVHHLKRLYCHNCPPIFPNEDIPDSLRESANDEVV